MIIMDEDSSTIKNIQQLVPKGDKIIKGSNPIHLKKIFIKYLKELKNNVILPFKNQKGILSALHRVQSLLSVSKNTIIILKY